MEEICKIKVREEDERLWNIAWSRCGRWLASCGEDKSVRLWEYNSHGNLQPGAVLGNVHRRTVRRVAWAADGKHLAAASFDGTVSVWECSDDTGTVWDCLAALEGHENEVKAVAYDSKGNRLATCSRDKSVWIWAVDGDEFECLAVLHGHSQDVKCVLWHPHRDLLVSTSYDDTLRFWSPVSDMDDYEPMDVLAGHQSTVWDAAFSPKDDKLLASASADRTVLIWQEEPEPTARTAVKWKTLHTLGGVHALAIYSVDWSSADLLASAGADNRIAIYSAKDFKLKHVQDQAHSSDVNCVRWHPSDPTLLASCGDDGYIRLWKVSTAP